MASKTEQARTLYRRLGETTDAMLEDRISFAEFTRSQRATWDEIQAACLSHQVLALIRADLPGVVGAEAA